MTTNIHLEVYCHLAYYRKLRNMSQEQLANSLGISRNAVSSIENGGECYNTTAMAICALLGFSHEDIWEVKDWIID